MEEKRLAIFGDIHGCAWELRQLYSYVRLKYNDKIEFWHVGDLVDRGPESGKVIDFVMKNFDGGVAGNHERTIIKQWDRQQATGFIPKNPDKARTLEQLDERKANYLKSLPLLHVFDDLKMILVHGGLYPEVPLHIQARLENVCRLQMLKMSDVDRIMDRNFCINEGLHNRWWGSDAKRQPKVGKTELQSIDEGYQRWYEVYDHEYDVIFGHSVMGIEPKIFQGTNEGKAIAIDTGSCFGGMLTAFIYPDMNYIQMPCEEYAEGKSVKRMMEEEDELKRRIEKRKANGISL